MKITRRKLIITGAATGATGAVLAGLGAQTLYTSGPLKTYVEDILKRHVPDVDVLKETVNLFVEDLLAAGRITRKERLVSYGGGVAASGLRMANVRPVETYERRVVTWFLISSNYFETDKEPDAELEYYGFSELVCAQANPFAEFMT